MKKLAILFLISLFVFSCKDNSSDTPQEAAIQINIDEVGFVPGFSTYRSEYDAFDTDDQLVNQIAQNINEDDKYVFYIKPNCGCNKTKFTFPHLMKILEEAGIEKSQIEIYSMTSVYNEYPYDDLISLSDVPNFYAILSGETYQIVENETVLLEQTVLELYTSN